MWKISGGLFVTQDSEETEGFSFSSFQPLLGSHILLTEEFQIMYFATSPFKEVELNFQPPPQGGLGVVTYSDDWRLRRDK